MQNRLTVSAGIVWTLAGIAYGQSATAPATRPADGAAAFTSYQQLRQHFSERQNLLNKQLLRERLAALESFFATAKGEEREKAFRDFVSAASDLGHYARAVEIADRYAKEFGSSPGAGNVAAMGINALTEQDGKLDAALAAWTRLADSARPNDWGAVFDAGIRIGDAFLLTGRTAEARKQYDDLNRRMNAYPNVGPFLMRRGSAVSWVGREALAIEGDDLAGKPARLEDYRGRIVLLDFWSTACVPCLREMPGVVKTYEEHHAEGFDVIGICLDPDVATLKAFLAQNQVPWRQVCDGQSWRGPNATKYSVRAVPTMFLVGRDGKIAFMPLSAEDLDYALTKLLKMGPTRSASAGR